MSIVTIARADFSERTRRFGFFVFMVATLGMGWLVYEGHVVMLIGNVKGVFNSAWIGTLMALTAASFVSMVGFYVVKNAIENDRKTGVGEILCTTALTSSRYLLSKWLSNAMILSSVLALLAVASAVLQLASGEAAIDVVALLSPVVMIGLPSVFVVAAMAVVFETIPFLRGGFGNVFYFFFWSFGVMLSNVAGVPALDWLGFSFIKRSLEDGVRQATGQIPGMFSYTIGGGRSFVATEIFEWNGIHWTPWMVALRIVPVVLAAGLVAASALWFDRFDPARRTSKKGSGEPAAERHGWEAASGRLESVGIVGRSRLAAMIVAELRVMLARANRWWSLAALGMAFALLVTPADAARGVMIPALLWPVLFWSRLGMRERWYGTDQILFSTPNPILNQLAATWFAGVALSVLTTGTWAVRTMAAGNIDGTLHWIVGALFVPSLALCLGVWSGTSRLFEALYTGLWYVGIANATPGLDFIGVVPGSSRSTIATFATATVVLLLLAVVGRRRQLDGA